MLTLGIETSCDETAASVVLDGRKMLSNVISSQVALHREFGGVVPELAARSHVERLPAVVDAALADAGIGIDDVQLVAVTRGPGLVGALLTGVGFATAMAWERGLPIVGVSHLDGHLHSAFLQSEDARLPLLVLIVSGGHTELVLFSEDGTYQLLGHTLDDAAGEAFDKVARMLGLPYPGGPPLERAAAESRSTTPHLEFPLPAIKVEGLDFSFSGIKTAVRYRLERELGITQGGGLTAEDSGRLEHDRVVAAARMFQGRVVQHLVEKLVSAALQTTPATIAIVGGVALNRALAQHAIQRLAAAGVKAPVVVPGPTLCTDNAAMIAAAGHALWQRGEGRSLAVDPSLRWQEAKLRAPERGR